MTKDERLEALLFIGHAMADALTEHGKEGERLSREWQAACAALFDAEVAAPSSPAQDGGDLGPCRCGLATCPDRKLLAEVARLQQELRVTDELLKARQSVLDAIPECQQHGPGCVPHALDWIADAKIATGDRTT